MDTRKDEALTLQPMGEEHRTAVLEMMRVFYASPAVHTDGSEAIFQADVDACLQPGSGLEGYVLCIGGKLCGYTMLARSFSTEFGRPCVWIEDLYLKDEYRGRGLGGQALAQIALLCPQALLRLEAEAENRAALRLYKGFGFEELPYMELKK